MRKVQNFWVITKPTKHSTLIDILSNADMKRMELQFKGGLSESEIIGTFTTKPKLKKLLKTALLKAGAIKKF